MRYIFGPLKKTLSKRNDKWRDLQSIHLQESPNPWALSTGLLKIVSFEETG